MKYFNNINNMEELKNKYKELAREYHPDINPEGLEAMKLINNEYDVLFNQLKDSNSDERSVDYINIIERLLEFNNITIEIIGTWIWLHGEKPEDTYSIKEELNQIGFRWSRGKKLWYLAPNSNKDTKKSYRYKQDKLETIRSNYGSQIIKSKKQAMSLS